MSFFSTLKLLFSKKDKISVSRRSEKSKQKKSPSTTYMSATEEFNSTTNSKKESIGSESKQLSSDGKNFKYRDGRRYHGNDEVAYLLPNDDDEADRVHQQHWVLRYVLQRNFHAPVTQLLEEGAVVLDSGCGPATWTFEMGETYPRSKFYGVDCSSVFPGDIKPANVEFEICNIAKNIPYPDNTFDYIHQRLLILGLTDEDWDSALKELFRVLKPGGYIDLSEPDLQDLCNMGPLIGKLQNTMSSMLRFRGMPPKIACELEDRLTKAGFVNPKTKVTPLHMNHTDKAGELLWADYKHLYLNSQPVFAKFQAEWEDPAAFTTFIEAASAESKENKTSANWYATYAQKPME